MRTRSAINSTINNDINIFYSSVWNTNFSSASNFGRMGEGGSERGARKQRMKQSPSEEIKHN